MEKIIGDRERAGYSFERISIDARNNAIPKYIYHFKNYNTQRTHSFVMLSPPVQSLQKYFDEAAYADWIAIKARHHERVEALHRKNVIASLV